MAQRGLGTLTLDLLLRTGSFVQGADAAERALQRTQEAMRSFKKEGERLAASVASPFDTFTKSLQLYNEALKTNQINQQTYNRLVADTTATLAAANTTQQVLTKAQRDFNAAMEIANERYRSGGAGIDVYTREIEQLKAQLDAATAAEQAHAKALENAGKLAAKAITPLEQYRAKLAEIAAAKIAAPQLITPKVEQRLTGAARQEFLGADPAIVGRTQKLADAMRSYNALVVEGRALTKQFGTTAQQEYRDTFRALTRLALAGEITPEIRTAALKEAKILLDSLNPEIQRMNELEAEAQRINAANIGPQEAHNAALKHLDLLLEETTLGVSAYNKEVAKQDAILKAATTSQTENNKAYANAKRLADSARTDLEKYLDAIREIQAQPRSLSPELITPPVQARLVRGVEERFDPKTKQEIAQRQELDRILQANITTLERYEAELRVVKEAQKSGTGDAAELAKAHARLTEAIKAEDPALQTQKAGDGCGQGDRCLDGSAASSRSPTRMAEIRAQAQAFPTIVTPTIETAALAEQQKRLDDLNGVTQENNRLEAEAARIKAANVSPQETYNNALASTAELVRLNKISQADKNAEDARSKAILDATDATLKEHNALMAEGAALTKSVMTAQERYDAEVARANKLYATYDATLKRTAISQQDYARAVARSKAALDQATNGVQRQSKGFFTLRQDLLGINGLLIRFTSIYTAVGAIRGIIKIVDDYKLLENRLTTVTESTAQLTRVQNQLFEIAQRTRQEYAGVVDLYVRLAQAGKELGASQSNLLKFTEAVGNAFAISGTTAERARAALVQLSQGLATGTFRAEEFNSVNEASPALIRAVAANIDRFKGSVGALRNAVREGTLTSKEFFEGTIAASAQLAQTVAGMPLTISQAFTQLKNTFEKIVSTADMGPLVESIQTFTALIKDPAFQRDLAAFVDLIVKLAGAAIRLGGIFARLGDEIVQNTRAFGQVSGLADLGLIDKNANAQIENLEFLRRKYHATLDNIEARPLQFTSMDKEKVLQDIQDIEDRLAAARNAMGTAFTQGTAYATRTRGRGTDQTTTNIAVEKIDKDAEAAQKSILNLIDSMRQQMAVTGETEEATIRYRIAFGDLRDEFNKAGPTFERYKNELIKTARALDQFKARQDIKKQTEALRAEVVELQAARIEEEQGAVAALKFRREHNVEMAKTIALARGETVALENTVEAVKAIPPIKLQADTTEAEAAIKKVADIPTPTLKVDLSQSTALLKQLEEVNQKIAALKVGVDTSGLERQRQEILKKLGDLPPAELKFVTDPERVKADVAALKAKVATEPVALKVTADTAQATTAIKKVSDPWALMQKNLKTPVTVKVDTTQAEKQFKKAVFDVESAPVKLGVDTSEVDTALFRVKALENLGITVKVKTDTAPAEKALTKVQANAAEIEARGAIARASGAATQEIATGHKAVAAAATEHAAAIRTVVQVTEAYNEAARLNEGLLETAAIAQQSAANTVAAQVKAITDEITAVQAEKIALEEGAVAALNYNIAHGNLQKTFEQIGGSEYLVIIKDLEAQIAAAGGSQKELNEQLDKAKASYANAQVAAANLADQLRIVTEYQERLAQQKSALEASFQYIPDAEAAAKQYALVVEGLTARLKAGKISQEQFNEAVRRADKDYQEATKSLDELSVFAEQAAKNMQDAFAEFLEDPFKDGLQGMLDGMADMLRKMSAQIIAAKLFEKFGIEEFLKSGSLTSGPGMEKLKGWFGMGQTAPELQPVAVAAERMPRTMSDAALAELEKKLSIPSTALTNAGATLQTSSAALQTGATTLQTGATTLSTAAQSLLTATQALGQAPAAIAQPVAAAVIDEFPEIVVSQERLPEGRVAAGGAVGAQGAGVAGMPAGASGLVSSQGPWDPLKDIFKNFLTESNLIWGPAAPFISALKALQVFNPGYTGPGGGGGVIMNLLGGGAGGGGGLTPIDITAQRMPEGIGAVAGAGGEAAAGTAMATALTTAGTTVATALTTAATTASTAFSTAIGTAMSAATTALSGAGTAVASAITAAGTAAASAIAAAATGGSAASGLSSIALEGFDFSGAGFAGGGLVKAPVLRGYAAGGPTLPRIAWPAVHADEPGEQPTLLRTLERLGQAKRATDVRRGGMLYGPGTPTSDSLLLLGSTKEFMVQAKAVAQPGAMQFLNAFNRGQIRMETLREALKDLPHFHSGGPLVKVVAPPAYANGGMVMPTMGTVSSQSGDKKPPLIQQITINSPQGHVSRQTEMQVTAAAARGVRVADRHNN